ncbi:MAG: hypothetical protein K8H90_04910 [Thermoanaerobaculia bacterium]|nr:hypothetical protein [Thermoanaerobaculia bacterium]
MSISGLRALPSLLLFLIAGFGARPASATPVPSQVESSWIELEPEPDDRAKVDVTGEYFVYLEAGEPGAPPELWGVSNRGGEPWLLSGARSPKDRISAFTISPDGRRVAFALSTDGGPRQIFWVAITGGTPLPLLGDRLATRGVERFAFRADSLALGLVRDSDPIVVLLGSQIFSNDFESADSSGWSDTTPNACPTPIGGPTLHANSILASETWTANASPHVLTSNVLVPVGVTLTVAPCAEVRVRPGFDLTVQGSLVAVGTPLQRIAFRRDDAALPWDSIWVESPGFAWLAFLDLSGGGAAGAAVLAEGVDTLPAAQPLRVDHLKVTGSTSYGIRLFRHAGFAAGSRDLVVTGSGATDPAAPFPIRMSLNTVGTLPVGSYTGNASDLIQVIGEGSSAVRVDDTFRDRGVPYQIGGPAGAFGLLVVDGTPTLSTLTIDPGVEIRFYSAGSNIGGLFVGVSGGPVATGRLIAAGTAAEPILFTGAGGTPTAGSWEGITFFGALAAGNVLDHVQIDAAGANGGDAGFGCPPAAFPETSGALKIFAQAGSSFLTNSTITRSSTHGIFRAWIGAQVDFMPGNTFTDVLFCNQVLPRPPLPAICPANPECPQ